MLLSHFSLYELTKMTLSQKMLKRFFDILVSILGIIAIIIPICLMAILIKLTSKGSVFFTQKRIGKNGLPFTVIKFKTMYENSNKYGFVTTALDSRITPIGRFLRKYKLDEFPQLWNVFIGKMSFVGPRPDVPGYADKLQGESRKILQLRPGMTGPASIFFRNEEEVLAKVSNPQEYNDTILWPKKVELNLLYLENWSFWKDIGYILITIIPPLEKWVRLDCKL